MQYRKEFSSKTIAYNMKHLLGDYNSPSGFSFQSNIFEDKISPPQGRYNSSSHKWSYFKRRNSIISKLSMKQKKIEPKEQKKRILIDRTDSNLSS